MLVFFFFSSRRRHTRCYRDWSSDVCSSDLDDAGEVRDVRHLLHRLIALEVLHQAGVGEDQAVGAHPTLLGDAPAVGVDAFDLEHMVSQCGMRNSECGIEGRASISHSALRIPHSYIRTHTSNMSVARYPASSVSTRAP